MDYLWKTNNIILNSECSSSDPEQDVKEGQVRVSDSQLAANINKSILKLFGKFVSEDGSNSNLMFFLISSYAKGER